MFFSYTWWCGECYADVVPVGIDGGMLPVSPRGVEAGPLVHEYHLVGECPARFKLAHERAVGLEAVDVTITLAGM